VQAGEICAMFGLDCASGDTFTDGAGIAMTSIKVPDPVVSLAVTPQTSDTQHFFKALARFQREDPTFRVHTDNESGEIIMSGMGELHLEVYAERIRREYGIACTVGNPKARCCSARTVAGTAPRVLQQVYQGWPVHMLPCVILARIHAQIACRHAATWQIADCASTSAQVNYRESITMAAPFNYTHKKQSGGSGQYGKVCGRIEPLAVGEADSKVEFVNKLTGTDIPGQFVPSIEKGFNEAMAAGALTGHPVEVRTRCPPASRASGCNPAAILLFYSLNTACGKVHATSMYKRCLCHEQQYHLSIRSFVLQGVRVVLETGGSHPVDSSDVAFRLAAVGAFRQAFANAAPVVLEPQMSVEVRPLCAAHHVLSLCCR
jgi:translation elongation factor EF-G